MADLDLLSQVKAILDIPSNVKGFEYFHQVSENCSQVLGCEAVLIGQVNSAENLNVSVESIFMGGALQENFNYDLAGTPCFNVFNGKRVCTYADKVDEQFPEDLILKDLGIKSYSGAPMFSDDGDMIGIFVIMDDKKLLEPDLISTIVEFLSQRIAVEFNRMNSENYLMGLNEELERKVEERTLELSNTVDKLKESVDSNRKLLSTLFHDVVNPLNVISLSAEEEEGLSIKDYVKRFSSISRASKEISLILKHVRQSFSEVQTSKKELDIINLDEVVEYANFVFEAPLKEKKIKLNVAGEACPTFRACSILFKNSIFNNFISNAIKFSPIGGVISISWVETSDYLIIKINDEGEGISKEAVASFNASKVIVSTMGTNNEKGNGFGLYQAKSYLDEINGSIEIQSCLTCTEISKGTEISLKLAI